MPLSKEEPNRPKGQGNWLGKQRHNFNITYRCWDMLHELAKEYGINHGSMLEICVREKYKAEFGTIPPIRHPGGATPR